MATGNGKTQLHRRRMIALLIASLALLGWLICGMVTDLRSRPVSYLVQHIQPVNPYLCPGDALRYEVQVTVTQVPVILEITESWCKAGLGRCMCQGIDDDLQRAGVGAAIGVCAGQPDRAGVGFFPRR